MKKIIIYISIMVSNCASLGAQSRELTATANLSKGGDSIYYDFITATVPQSSGFFGTTMGFLQFQISWTRERGVLCWKR